MGFLMGCLLICAGLVCSSHAVKALRRAKVGIPVSETAMNDLEVFNQLLQVGFLVYALRCRSLDFYPEFKQKIQETFKERSLLLFSASATVSEMLNYFGYSSRILFPTLAGVFWLFIHTVKPAWMQDESPLSMFFLSLTFLNFPQIALISVVIQVPCFHFQVIEPYSKNLFATSPIAAQIYANRKYLEIVSAISGNAVMTYYLRFPSKYLILALGLFAIAALILFAFIKPCTDFGIIQFLVVSGIQCAVSLSLLNVFTFLAVVGGCGIMAVKRMIEVGQYPKLVISFLEWMKTPFHPENRPGCCQVELHKQKMVKFASVIICSLTLAIGSPQYPVPPEFTASRLGHPLIAMTINSLYLVLWGWKLLPINGYEAYQSVWEGWRGIIGIGGDGSNPIGTLFLYVRFRQVLHVLSSYPNQLPVWFATMHAAHATFRCTYKFVPSLLCYQVP